MWTLQFPRALKMHLYLLLNQAHLVRFCTAAVAKGAVRAESVAFGAWRQEEAQQK